jgi:hypothetical protein
VESPHCYRACPLPRPTMARRTTPRPATIRPRLPQRWYAEIVGAGRFVCSGPLVLVVIPSKFYRSTHRRIFPFTITVGWWQTFCLSRFDLRTRRDVLGVNPKDAGRNLTNDLIRGDLWLIPNQSIQKHLHRPHILRRNTPARYLPNTVGLESSRKQLV